MKKEEREKQQLKIKNTTNCKVPLCDIGDLGILLLIVLIYWYFDKN
jgi:hypothetical protein